MKRGFYSSERCVVRCVGPVVLFYALVGIQGFGEENGDASSPLVQFKHHNGWTETRGETAIKRSTLRDTDGAPFNLVLEGAGEAEIDQPKGNRNGQDAVTFYQFRFNPSFAAKVLEEEHADESRGAGKGRAAGALARSGGKSLGFAEGDDFPTVDVGGARLGWRLSADSDHGRNAELIAYVGLGQASGMVGEDGWMTTGVHFEVRDDGRVTGHAPIVVRADSAKGVWDLYLYNDLFLVDLPYRKRFENLVVKTASDGETSIQNLRITDHNPLFEDEDLDGIPDDFAATRGVKAREEPVEPDGPSLLVEYLAREKWAREE